MKDYDEPMFIDVKRNDKLEIENSKTVDKTVYAIKNLCEDQSFGVLSTQGLDQPYSSLISFTTTEDLSHIVFATPIQTRKFNLIKQNAKVSLLIDNRSNQPDSINRISALTAIGSVKILTEKDEIDEWSEILRNKHYYLKKFIEASSTALIVITVSKYFYVRRFQEVIEWIPPQNL